MFDKKITKQVVTDSVSFFNTLRDEHVDNPQFIPESLQPYIANFVRKGRAKFDALDAQLFQTDKSSDEYIIVKGQIEKIAKSFVNAKSQLESYKKQQGAFRDIMNEINPGTKDEDYYRVAAVLGNQWSSMAIDDDGAFYFAYDGVMGKSGKTKKQFVKLDKLASLSPIITEPFDNKKFVFNLANQVKKSKDQKLPFDGEWIFKTTLDQLAQSTPYQVIGTAFTDLAGDNRTKSFAELYVDGLNDKLLYENPETGEKLPKDNMWMKDIKNNGVLSQLLAKFITNTMREVYGTVEAAKPLVDIKSKTNYYRNYYNEVREGLKLNPKELVKKYLK
tara:strand:- start:489 stop:1484 length:996 start_codon:yes stop_codon:yes gene_type:complete